MATYTTDNSLPPQAPHCLLEPDLQCAMKVALNCPLEDIVKHAELTNEHIHRLDLLGGLKSNGTDLFGEIKMVREREEEGEREIERERSEKGGDRRFKSQGSW